MLAKAVSALYFPVPCKNDLGSCIISYISYINSFSFYTGGGSGSCESTVTIKSTWSTGASGLLHVTFPKTVSSWKIEITFSSPVTSLTLWDGSNVLCSGNICSFENQGWNAQQFAGSKAKIDFLIVFASLPHVKKVMLDGADLCSRSGGQPPAVTTTTSLENLGNQVIKLPMALIQSCAH